MHVCDHIRTVFFLTGRTIFGLNWEKAKIRQLAKVIVHVKLCCDRCDTGLGEELSVAMAPGPTIAVTLENISTVYDDVTTATEGTIWMVHMEWEYVQAPIIFSTFFFGVFLVAAGKVTCSLPRHLPGHLAGNQSA